MFFYKNICSEVFDIKNINNDILEMNTNISKLMENMPPSHEIPFEILRKIRSEGGGMLPNQPKSEIAINRNIEFNETKVSIREIRKTDANFVYLHIHGGGFCLGSSDGQDFELEKLSNEINCSVLSVDYRLAPEHAYPAAADDCETVALWLIENLKNEYGAEKIVIGGESAGAHLCVTTLLRLKNKNVHHKIKALNLIFGTYNANTLPSEINSENENLLLSSEMMKKFEDSYLQNNEDKTNPDVSPMFGNFSDMPPAIFTIGTRDLLLDHTLLMHSRWITYGNKAELVIVPGADHAFIAFPCETTSAVIKELNKFILMQIN